MTYPEGYTVVTLNPCNRGRNKVGVAAHKPAKARTKRAKRQGNPMGRSPALRKSRIPK